MKKYTSKTNFDYDKIDSDVLEWFPYEYEGERIILRTYSDEFTCTCPWSSLPDFATVTVAYEPHKRCVELKSFKIYICRIEMLESFTSTQLIEYSMISLSYLNQIIFE